MRRLALTFLPLGLLLASGLAALARPVILPSSRWLANETAKPIVATKWKLENGTGGSFAFYNAGVFAVTLSGEVADFSGSLASDLPGSAFVSFNSDFVAGGRSIAGEFGGKYAFSTLKETSSTVIGAFYISLAAGLLQLDSSLPAGAEGRIAGEVQVLLAKGTGKTKTAADHSICSGKFKTSFVGTVLDGPNAGVAIKGTLAVGWTNAHQDMVP